MHERFGYLAGSGVNSQFDHRAMIIRRTELAKFSFHSPNVNFYHRHSKKKFRRVKDENVSAPPTDSLRELLTRGSIYFLENNG